MASQLCFNFAMARPGEEDTHLRVNIEYSKKSDDHTAVAGYAVGGGHVLHMVCNLTIAAKNAIFGQTGPKPLKRKQLKQYDSSNCVQGCECCDQSRDERLRCGGNCK